MSPFGLFDPVLPPGARLAAEVLDAAAEERLAAGLAALPVQPFQFGPWEGRRRVAYFGWAYDFGAGRLAPAPPVPDFLLRLRDAAAAALDLDLSRFEQVLATEYAPGAGIGWHRDRPVFDEVVGVSLLSPCTFRFRRARPGGGWERLSAPFPPRSAYLLSGPARSEWEHSIPPVAALRWSVTFRSLRTRG